MHNNIFYTTQAICYSYKLSKEMINEMVAWGIAEPCIGNEPGNWIFNQQDFERIGCASRFNKELEINVAGAALAIELLKDIENLRKKES